MFQDIPSADYYKQFKGSLTQAELDQQQIPMIKYGAKTFTSKILNDSQVDVLNQIAREINRTRSKDQREYLLDRKHQQFCIFAEC